MTRVPEARRSPRLGEWHWTGEEWRRWNGRRWVRALAAARSERLRNPAPFAPEDAVDDDLRARVLALAIEEQVLTNDAHVVFQGPDSAVIAHPRVVSHPVHAVLTVVSVGLWWPLWKLAAAARRKDRYLLEVDRYANVWVRRDLGSVPAPRRTSPGRPR